MDSTSSAFRGLWLAIIVVAGAVVATSTGLIFYVAHAPMLGIVGSSGVAFAASVTLGIAAWKFVADSNTDGPAARNPALNLAMKYRKPGARRHDR